MLNRRMTSSHPLEHPLDRPVWSALTTRQADRADGGPLALRFAPRFGLFAASADGSAQSLAALYALIPPGGEVALVEAGMPALPPDTVVVSRAVCNQMIADVITPGPAPDDVVTLGDGDADDMLALATLTRPGPFFSHTHQLGRFIGTRQNGRLAAMAGERMCVLDNRLGGFTEVSGVCTHPDFRGRRYAGGLMRRVAQQIVARGDTPFLHVYADNHPAIALYEALGFRFRAALTMTVLRRP